jgi:hypothetical protein
MKFNSFFIIIILLTALNFSCTKIDPMKLTLPMDLPESSEKPSITIIHDYGSYTLPSMGKISAIKGDNSFVIGEILLIRGKNFGRLPTVTVAKKATPILLRLQDGAIIVRVPNGIAAGNQKVIVATESGITFKEIAIKRFALASVPGAKKTILLDGYNWKKISSYSMGKVEGFKFSSKSPTAYILSSTKKGLTLLTMDLSKIPLPKLVDKKIIGKGNLLGFGYSSSKDVLVVITDKGITGFSLSHPLFPIAHSLQKWPKGTIPSKMIKGDLSPDGKTVVVLTKTDNSVALFDIQVLDNLKKGPVVPILPESKVPLLKTLGFKKEKSDQTLYVVTGDTPESLKIGYHTMNMVEINLKSAQDGTSSPSLKILETKPLMVDKGSPSSMDISIKGASKAEDTSLTKWTRYYYYSIFHAELLTFKTSPLSTPSGIQKGIELLGSLSHYGILHRLDQKGNPKQFKKVKKVTGSMAISPDGKNMLLVNCTPEADKAKLAIKISCEAEVVELSTGKSTLFKMGKLKNKQFVPPFIFGATAIQD